MDRPPLAVQGVAGVLTGLLAVTGGPAAVGGATVLAAVPLVHPRARGARAFGLALLLGVVVGARGDAAPRTDRLAARLPAGPLRGVFEGTVAEADPPTPRGVPFLLDVDTWTTADGPVAGPVRLRGRLGPPARDGAALALSPGDRVTLAGDVTRVPAPTNPGQFDARELWGRRGVFGRLDVPDPTCVERHVPSVGLAATLARGRHAAARRLDVAFGADDAGLLRSLLLGDRGALAADDRARFVRAGAAHILAISGAHVALLVAGLLRALRAARVPSRVAAGVVGLGVVLFVPFTGSSPPVVRSAAGFVLFLAGRLLGREPRGGLLLAAVALGYLTLDPRAAADPGFRMSFAAAAGLVLLAGRLRRGLVGEPPVLGGPPPAAPVRSALAAGLAAWAASTPVTIHDLGQSGWVAIPVGLVAVPLSTAAMLLGVVALAVAGVPGAGDAARVGTEAVLAALRACLDAPVALGVTQAAVVRPGGLWYVAYGLAFLAAARAPRSVALAGGVALVALLAALPRDLARAPPAHPRLTVLDVGHGQAALLETPTGETALLDAGSRDRPDVADRVVLPALRALGVTALDLAVASHADVDHAGALAPVAEVVPVRALVVPPRFAAAVRARIEPEVGTVLVAVAGDVLLAGPWGRLVVAAPARAPGPDVSTNDGCLVLRLETPHGTVLLPGDREARGVAALEADGAPLEADVLVLPHHGLPGPGRERLRSLAGARVEVASGPAPVGPGLSAPAWVTGRDGAVTVHLAPGGPYVTAVAAGAAPLGDGGPGPPSAPYDPQRVPMPDPAVLGLAAVLLVAVVAASVRLRWLTPPAALAAGVLGFVAVLGFSWSGLAALLAPFLVATLLGKLPGGLEDGGPRALRQVLANGLPGAVGLGLAAAGAPGAAAAFAGAFAALGGDTVATEVGTRYGGRPRHALTGRPLERGESGGVTVAGLLGSVGGATLAPAAMAAAGGLSARAALAAAVGGVVAAYADSVLGAVLQRKGTCPTCHRRTEAATCCGARVQVAAGRLAVLDNDAVNLVNGLVGAAVAWGVAGALGAGGTP